MWPALRNPLLSALLLIFRCSPCRSVISDTESVSVISEYTSSAGVNAAEAPMFDEDVTAWGEFQAMRDVILQFGELECHMHPRWPLLFPSEGTAQLLVNDASLH